MSTKTRVVEAPKTDPDDKLRDLAQSIYLKHSHYFKDVKRLKFVDVYRVLRLFQVIDPELQHAIKKLLVAGGRGGGKDISRDIQEAIDTLRRWQEIQAEDNA